MLGSWVCLAFPLSPPQRKQREACPPRRANLALSKLIRARANLFNKQGDIKSLNYMIRSTICQIQTGLAFPRLTSLAQATRSLPHLGDPIWLSHEGKANPKHTCPNVLWLDIQTYMLTLYPHPANQHSCQVKKQRTKQPINVTYNPSPFSQRDQCPRQPNTLIIGQTMTRTMTKMFLLCTCDCASNADTCMCPQRSARYHLHTPRVQTAYIHFAY